MRDGCFVLTAVQISIINADIAKAFNGKGEAANAERYRKKQAAATRKMFKAA